MAAIAYLFLLTIPFASAGIYFPRFKNGVPPWMQPKYPYQRTFPDPNSDISPEAFIEDCRSRRHYTSTLQCYLELQSVYKRFRKDSKPSLENQALKTNTRKPIPGISKDKNDKVNNPESFINSILDEDKRDASNFNSSENDINSTWIEIQDPRKVDTEVKSEIAEAKETDVFVTFSRENAEISKKDDSSMAGENGNETSSITTDGLNKNRKTTTDIQQTITGETSDIVTTKVTDDDTTVTEETGDITKGVIRGKTTANHDTIVTVGIDEENKGNTDVQQKTTGLSFSENVDKSTASDDLYTDSVKLGFNVTTENAIVNETDTAVTTVDEIDIEVTTVNETDIDEVTTVKEDRSSSAEQNLSTKNHGVSTSKVPLNLSNDTTLATDDSTTSTVFITTPPADAIKSESVSISVTDISASSKIESATSSTSIDGRASESSHRGFTSTVITDSKTSNYNYVTKSNPVVPEHIVKIRSIKIAKVVLSVLLLMTGLIAVVMIAVYLFRVRRGSVQYDQLTLLP